jgi:hypothetical protein
MELGGGYSSWYWYISVWSVKDVVSCFGGNVAAGMSFMVCGILIHYNAWIAWYVAFYIILVLLECASISLTGSILVYAMIWLLFCHEFCVCISSHILNPSEHIAYEDLWHIGLCEQSWNIFLHATIIYVVSFTL